MNVAKVSAIAHRAREIVEEVSWAVFNPIGPFPAGWCQDCSIVLARLLEECDLHGFKLVIGARGTHGSATHSWLKQGELIVDITADQFEGESMPPVIVGSESLWHDQWQGNEEVSYEITNQVQHELFGMIRRHPFWISGAPSSTQTKSNSPNAGHVRPARDLDLIIIEGWLPEDDIIPSMRNNWDLSKKVYETEGMLVWEDFVTQMPVAYFWGDLNSCSSVIDIHPKYRRRGIGRAFVEHLVEISRERDEPLLKFQCAPESSVPFWKAMGFEVRSEGTLVFGAKLIARKILKISKDIPEGIKIPVSIKFFAENATDSNSCVTPLAAYSLFGIQITPGTIALNELVACYSPLGDNDLIVEIIVANRQVCREKAKYSLPRMIGVTSCENGFAVHTLKLSGCQEVDF